jgi:glycosyltransferase involved in cell wall biosynthesis
MKKEIIFISRGDMTTNASTIRAFGLGKELSEMGYSVHLLIPDHKNNRLFQNEYGSWLRLLYSRQGIFEFISKINLLFRSDINYDIIHSINVGTNSFLVALVYKLFHWNVTLVTDIDEWNSKLFTNPFKRKYISFLETLSNRYSDKIIFASQYLEKNYVTSVSTQRYYMPYAVDIKSFSEKSKGYQQYELADSCQIVYLGSFQAYFGIEILMDSTDKILHNIPNATFTLIGDGPTRNQLEKRAHQEYPGRYSFKGFLNDNEAYRFLCAASILILPLKDSEINRSRCPNKVFLYMAAQRPIVTTHVGEVPTILGVHAHYYQDGNVDSFVETVYEAKKHPIIVPEKIISANSWAYRAHQYDNIVQINK